MCWKLRDSYAQKVIFAIYVCLLCLFECMCIWINFHFFLDISNFYLFCHLNVFTYFWHIVLAVPMAVIASFRKMKKLTRDYALIAAALRESSFLVIFLFSFIFFR